EVLADAVLRWAGIGPLDTEPVLDARSLAGMVDAAGRIGPPNWFARGRRLVAERCSRQLVTRARERDDDAPLGRLARFEEDGRPLPTEVAAVELLNLLRPTVAVARFVA